MKKYFLILLFILMANPALAIKQKVISGPSDILTTGTNYTQPMAGGSSSTTQTARSMVSAFNGKACNFKITQTVAPDGDLGTAGTQSVAYTLQNANADTVVTCTVSEADLSCSYPGCVDIVAGQRIGIEATAANTPDAANYYISMEVISDVEGETWVGVGSGGTSYDQTSNRFMTLGASFTLEATETVADIPIAIAGKFQNMYIVLSGTSNPGDVAFTLRRSATGTALTCLIEATTLCSDLVNAPSFSIGQLANILINPDALPTARRASAGLVFVPEYSDKYLFIMTNSNVLNAATTEYTGIQSFESWNATESTTHQLITDDIMVKKMCVTVDAAPGAGTSYTFSLRDDGASVASVTISETDTFECSNELSVKIAAGSYAAYEAVPAGTPATPNAAISLVILEEKTHIEGATLNGATIN